MSTILVTGAAGFIGFHTASALLDKGHRVIGIDSLNEYYDVNLKKARLDILKQNKDFVFCKADITDYAMTDRAFSKERIDKVCHLAAQAGVRYSIEHPESYESSNILGTFNIFELAKKHGINHVVAASSSSVYGGSKNERFSVDEPVEDPISLYAATKRGTELIGYYYSSIHNINTTCLRFFTVYGPWGRPDMALFKFTKNILAGKPIDVYNYGRMERDFTYIADIVDGILASLEKEFRYEVFNLGNSDTVKLDYFIGCIEKQLGKKAERNLMPLQKGDVPKTFADIEKTTKMLGFKPRTKIEDGISEFIRWYKEYHRVK